MLAIYFHSLFEFMFNMVRLINDETIANIAIILIRQTDYLLKRYFERIKQDFLEHGGIKEEMTRGRLQWRKEHQ